MIKKKPSINIDINQDSIKNIMDYHNIREKAVIDSMNDFISTGGRDFMEKFISKENALDIEKQIKQEIEKYNKKEKK